MTADVANYYDQEGEILSKEEAEQRWIPTGRAILVEIASSSEQMISYSLFSARLQRESGVRTTKPLPQWIGSVLDGIGRECSKRNQPLLSALCVRKDGTIGPGFARQFEEIYGRGTASDLATAARTEQSKCRSFEWPD